MVFSGIPFLYYFLPATLLLYFAAPRRLRNAVLLLASLVFYAWGEPRSVLALAAIIAQGYLLGILIEKPGKRGTKKLFLSLSLVLSLGMLCCFKYVNFLPLGISFVTLHLISYAVDVYLGKAAAQRNPLDFTLYIAMFPRLIAGPIVHYAAFAAQRRDRSPSLENSALGIRRFVLGLGKKVLLANALGELCTAFKASGDRSVLYFWLYALSFTLRVYFDFSGYSDMAIGLGKVLGFHFPENFNYPYISRSVTEFCRRWHMSLRVWVRDYVYVPLGGSRRLLNLFPVWICIGLWHGAAWRFAVWGLCFALLLTVERLWLGRSLARSRLLCHVYTLLAVLFSFVFFDSTSLKDACHSITAMFGAQRYPLLSTEALYHLKTRLVLLIVAVLGTTPLPVRLTRRLSGIGPFRLLEPLFLLLILLISTSYIVDGSVESFLYFQF